MLQKNDRLPLYYQLMDIIVGQMDSGELKEHDRLPSERELCELYDVSRTTVRQTMQELEKSKLIYKIHGKGTFVSSRVIDQSLVSFYSFTDEMKKLGKDPTSQILAFNTIQADAHIAGQMRIEENEMIYQLIRLRLADGEPMMFETSYLPTERFPQLKKQDVTEVPLYQLFNEKYQVTISKAKERFKAIKTEKEVADKLHISKDEPSLFIERLTYEQENIVEYTVTIARGDKFTYSVQLQSNAD